MKFLIRASKRESRNLSNTGVIKYTTMHIVIGKQLLILHLLQETGKRLPQKPKRVSVYFHCVYTRQ